MEPGNEFSKSINKNEKWDEASLEYIEGLPNYLRLISKNYGDKPISACQLARDIIRDQKIDELFDLQIKETPTLKPVLEWLRDIELLFVVKRFSQKLK
jgi:hypothetical protein